MNKRNFNLACFVFFAFAALPTPAGAQTARLPMTAPAQSTSDIHSIVASGVLRVAISRFDIPPFHQHLANGTIVGKEAELAYQIAGALNVKVTFVDEANTFDEVIKLVADGRADIGLNALAQNYKAVMTVRFSEPYMTLRHALLYNRTMVAQEAAGGRPDDVLREFRGKIGIVAASPFVRFADRNFALATVIEFDTWKDALDGLRKREVDVLYNNEFEVRRVLMENPALHVEYGAAIMKDKLAFLAIAICDSCVKLQEFINFFMAQNQSTFAINTLLTAPFVK
jgi:polar amino acid transport system substrate-binding protein